MTFYTLFIRILIYKLQIESNRNNNNVSMMQCNNVRNWQMTILQENQKLKLVEVNLYVKIILYLIINALSVTPKNSQSIKCFFKNIKYKMKQNKIDANKAQKKWNIACPIELL